MKKLLLSFISIFLSCISLFAIENNQILYTTSDGNVITPNKTDVFGASIVSNTYKNGQGCITFDGDVTSIGGSAFYYCKGLTSITIPNSVTSIGSDAFYYCSGLTSITIPNSVTSIGSSAFNACKGINTIKVDAQNTVYDSRTNCNAIIKTETNELIVGCKSTIIPNSVTSIGSFAFASCSGLTSINIPNSVTSIGSYAFVYCTGLTSINIPNSVTSIEKRAFSFCTGLSSITIPNSVTSIEVQAFSYCTGLSSITIPNSVTSIGAEAFSDCTGLTSITIPNSVTSIGGNVFYRCKGINTIKVDAQNTYYDSRNDCNAIIKTETNELIVGCKSTIIPNSVTSIGSVAISYCTGLSSITIPNSVTSIGSYAFVCCTGLSCITIPNSVTSIESGAFASCNNVKEVFCYATKVPTTGTDVYKDANIEYATLYVPSESIDSYKATSPWSSFGTIKALEEVVCLTPTIQYANGELSFDCKTDGVEFISEIKDEDIKQYNTSKISLSASYCITVYAKREGLKDSEPATATLCWIDVEPTQTGTTTSVNNIPANPVLIRTTSNAIYVEGIPTESVEFFNLSGNYLGSETVEGGRVSFETEEPFVIVKIGEKSIKIKK